MLVNTEFASTQMVNTRDPWSNYVMHKKCESKTYIRKWRKRRRLTLEGMAELVDSTEASLSRIERGLQPYNQPLLESLADALNCHPADLLMRDPEDPEGIWSLWDRLDRNDRIRGIELLKALLRSRDHNSEPSENAA